MTRSRAAREVAPPPERARDVVDIAQAEPPTTLARALPALVGAIVFVASIPLLARSPISGDGAEQVLTALHGGALHPPGFPLQSLIARLFVHVPTASPAMSLSLLSAVAHALAVAVVVRIVGAFGVHPIGRVVAGVAFAAFPPMWGLATQPEVFALAHLMMALLALQLVRLATRPEPPSTRDGALLGALVGAAGAQHAITILFAPAFLISLFLVARDPHERVRRTGAAALAFVTVFVGLYASLALQARGAVWPNWGALDTVSGLVRHALRSEYGTFSLMQTQSLESVHGLGFFAHETFRAWSVLLLAIPFGIAVVLRHRAGRALAVGLGGSLVAGLAFLAYAESHPPLRVAEGILERFDGAATLVCAVLIGLGVGDAASGLESRLARGVSALLLVIGCANLVVQGHARADASTDNTADVFRRALGATLPRDAVFLTHDDLEGFYGAELPDGSVRFPLIRGTLANDWYRRRVLPALEPRLASLADRADLTATNVVDAAREQHLVVASTDQHIVSPTLSRPSQLRGLFFVAEDGVFDQLSPETVEAAVALCPFAAELGPLPERGHFTARDVREVLFARAFQGASIYLRRVGEDEAAARAETVQHDLEADLEPTAWRRSCPAFVAAIDRLR